MESNITVLYRWQIRINKDVRKFYVIQLNRITNEIEQRLVFEENKGITINCYGMLIAKTKLTFK